MKMTQLLKIWKRGYQSGLNSNEGLPLSRVFKVVPLLVTSFLLQPRSQICLFSIRYSPTGGQPSFPLHGPSWTRHWPLLYWDYTQQTPPFLFFCLWSWMWHLLGTIISVLVGFHALCIGPWLESGNGYLLCTLKSTHTPQSFTSNFWSSQSPWSQSMVSKLIISSLYYKTLVEQRFYFNHICILNEPACHKY